MDGKLNPDIKIPNDREGKLKNPIIGEITKHIGQGEDAKNSLVYLTLKWGFNVGCVITVLVVINHWSFRKDEMIPNIGADIQLVWDIVVPLITLALGYAFGKSRD